MIAGLAVACAALGGFLFFDVHRFFSTLDETATEPTKKRLGRTTPPVGAVSSSADLRILQLLDLAETGVIVTPRGIEIPYGPVGLAEVLPVLDWIEAL